jgi:hypothetical protein
VVTSAAHPGASVVVVVVPAPGRTVVVVVAPAGMVVVVVAPGRVVVVGGGVLSTTSGPPFTSGIV